MTINERYEQGVPHDPRSIDIAKGIAQIDWDEGKDYDDYAFDTYTDRSVRLKRRDREKCSRIKR